MLVLLLALVAAASLSLGYSAGDGVPASSEHTSAAVVAIGSHAAGETLESPDGASSQSLAKNLIETNLMLRSFCSAASEVNDNTAPGGFARSSNHARKVSSSNRAKGLYLFAEPEVVLQLGKHPAMRLSLINKTDKLLTFAACDSRLDIVQEALDEDGEWKPIEYFPRSWCGNSYHRVFLAPNDFWEFPVFRYSGSFLTQLRFALTLSDRSVIYSNTFAGSINFEQFYDKEGHNATNIMDPYNE
jgi:hypothetical protein